LTQLGVPALGGAIYAGPGLGIALSGLAVSGMTALQGSAALAWGLFGALAALLSALVWPVFGTAVPVAAAAAAAPATSAPAHQGRFGREKAVFVLAYGLAGFGYIITATFLPVIARTALPASPWLDLFWPIFGVGVVIGALSATRLPMALDRRHLLAAGYLMQALGVAASIWSPSVAGFVLGSLLVGLPFTAITFFAMQEARRLQPTATASLMGLLTAAYGLGQIAGPPLATALLAHSATRDFTPSLQVAAAALVLGALTFAWLARRHPVRV
jgi:hypothetical protein